MIHIHAGTEIKRLSLGRAAAFCLACQTICSHEVFKLSSYSHISFIPISKSTDAGFEKVCDLCKTISPAKREKFLSFRPGGPVPLDQTDALILETAPTLPADVAEHQEYLDRLSGGEATPEERKKLITTVITDVVEQADRYIKEGKFFARVGIWVILLFLFVSVVIRIQIWGKTSNGASNAYQMTVIVLGTIGIMQFMAYQYKHFIYTTSRDYWRNNLGPIRPTLDEIEEVIVRLKARGNFARYLDARKIFQILDDDE